MKIYVSICSYRDPLLKYTLDSLIASKSMRHSVTYSIFEQTAVEDALVTVRPDLVERSDVVYKRIDPVYSDGVGWARSVNSMNVTDEDFYYQIDSHMLFDKDWDRALIEDYKRGVAKSGTTKVIIDGGTKSYGLDDSGVPLKYTEAFPKTTHAEYFHYGLNDILGVHGSHVPATSDINSTVHLFAGNLFTTTQWIKDVGNDHDIFWDGEEQLLTLRSFELGYYMYAPREIKCYHFIGTGDYVTKQWHKPLITPDQYNDRVQRSIRKWQKYLNEVSEDTLDKYKSYSGVDYINKIIEDRNISYPIKTGLGMDPVIPEQLKPPQEPAQITDQREEPILEEVIVPLLEEQPIQESESINDAAEDSSNM